VDNGELHGQRKISIFQSVTENQDYYNGSIKSYIFIKKRKEGEKPGSLRKYKNSPPYYSSYQRGQGVVRYRVVRNT